MSLLLGRKISARIFIQTFYLQVFSSKTKKELISHKLDVVQKCPQEGWAEEDPQEILSAIQQCVAQVVEQMPGRGLRVADIVSVGVTNQRETTIVWDKETGEPLYNAICTYVSAFQSFLQHCSTKQRTQQKRTIRAMIRLYQLKQQLYSSLISQCKYND